MHNQYLVYIADDQTLFRKGLMRLVQSFDCVGQVKGAKDGKEIIDLVKEKEPDVILMDYKMPFFNGAEASEIILNKYPEVKIVMLSFHNESDIVIDSMEKGVHGFLLKESDPEEVEKAIIAVLQKDFYNNDVVVRALKDNVKRNSKAKAQTGKALSEREKEVLALTCQELSAREIAAQLHIAEKTVHNHRANLIVKLGVRNTIGLVRYAVENNLHEIE